jgi:hypothetical protein
MVDLVIAHFLFAFASQKRQGFFCALVLIHPANSGTRSVCYLPYQVWHDSNMDHMQQ